MEAASLRGGIRTKKNDAVSENGPPCNLLLYTLTQGVTEGAGEMAQFTKCLLHKPRTRVQIPSTAYKTGMGIGSANLVLGVSQPC